MPLFEYKLGAVTPSKLCNLLRSVVTEDGTLSNGK